MRLDEMSGVGERGMELSDLLGRSNVMRFIMFSVKLVVFSMAAAVQIKFRLAIRCGAA